jgi:GT2 family glycosyltransferase
MMRIIMKELHHGEPKIPIIIPVADAQDQITKKCLKHLESCTDLPLSLFLVESSGEEFAYGKSMNAGIRAAWLADFIIGMDSDSFPKEGAIEKLIEYYHTDHRLGFVGVRLFQPHLASDVGWSTSSLFIWFLACIRAKAPFYAIRRLLKGNWTELTIIGIDKHKPGRMIGANTAMFLLRKKCYDDVGPFDETFRIGYADFDFVFRILTSEKWFVSSCLEAEVFHQRSVTQRAMRESPDIEGQKHFYRVWPKERMRAVRRSASEGKFIVAVNRNG